MRRGHVEGYGAVHLARINGYLGVVIEAEDGPFTVSFEPETEDRLAAVYVVRNPDKLGHLVR